MLKRLSKGLYHVIWYTFAAIILTAAVLVTIIRLALPDIGAYRDDIQLWVSQYMDYPVEIHDISANWEGWIPNLYLSNINLLDKTGTNVISHFHSAHLSLDPVASIANRQLVPRSLTVSGLGLTLTRRQNGSIDITGKSLPSSSNNEIGQSELAVWLLRQKKISIEKAQVVWVDEKSGQDPLFFPNVALYLKTYKDRLQISGSADLPVHFGNKIDFSLDITGNILTTQWSGTIYIKGEAISPQMFSEINRFAGITITNGFSDISTWTDWQNAKLVKFEGTSYNSDLELVAESTRFDFNKLTVRFNGQRVNDQTWDVNLKLDDISTGNGIWPQTPIHLQVDRSTNDGSKRYSGSLGYLKLDDILPLLKKSSFLTDSLREILTGYNVQGELTGLQFTYDSSLEESDAFTYSTGFEHLNIQSKDASVSINGLGGSATGNLVDTKIFSDSSAVSISLPSFYDTRIWLSSLQGDITLSRQDDNWKIEMGLVNARTSDFPVAISGSISRKNFSSPYADLIMQIGTGSMDKISDYLPNPVPEKIRNWIENALVYGDLLSGNIILHGFLSDFPFHHSEGRFMILANVSDATLDYHQNWPPIDNINADITYENNNLRIEASSGRIFNADIKQAIAIIDPLINRPHVLKINGTISGHTDDARHFINQSPLQNNTSLKELGHRQISGNIELELGLSIPFNKDHKLVNGKLKLIDTTFESEFPGLGLEKINGLLEFTNDSIMASGLSALYSNHPVMLDIKRGDGKVSGLNFTLKGDSDRDFIIEQLSIFFPTIGSIIKNFSRHIDGNTSWSLSVDNSFNESGKTVKHLVLSSDLQGLRINMPNPLGKTYAQSAPIIFTTDIIDSRITQLSIEYDSRIFAQLEVDNAEDFMVKQITISLGEKIDEETKHNGVFIKGNIDQLVTGDWFDLIKTWDGGGSTKRKRPEDFELDVTVATLNLFGIPADNSNLHVKRLQNGWEATIENADTAGKAVIPGDIENGIVSAHFNRLKIHSDTSAGKKSQINPGNLPGLDITVDEFFHNDLNLGKMIIRTSRLPDGISIDSVQFVKPDMQISGNGHWTRKDSTDNSKFTLDLHADQLASMLETFGYSNSSIENGATSMNLDAKWTGSPMEFSLDDINGILKLDINKGRFLNLQPSAGRLFGLLSLQTLPRRLALDFSDLFGKGFSFDQITGDFTLENGNAYTNDLSMRGPSADIIVTGRTGLQIHDYDQIVTITPQVSNSLPVASALFGPIGVGVGAVIFLAGEVFDSIPEQIDRLLRYQYSITGSWDEPVVEKIKGSGEGKNGKIRQDKQPEDTG